MLCVGGYIVAVEFATCHFSARVVFSFFLSGAQDSMFYGLLRSDPILAGRRNVWRRVG